MNYIRGPYTYIMLMRQEKKVVPHAIEVYRIIDIRRYPVHYSAYHNIDVTVK